MLSLTADPGRRCGAQPLGRQCALRSSASGL